MYCSNHGRQTNGSIAAVDALARIVEAIGGVVPILFDSGMRSGTDIVEALAIGAIAVGISRAYGLGVGGMDGPGARAPLAAGGRRPADGGERLADRRGLEERRDRATLTGRGAAQRSMPYHPDAIGFNTRRATTRGVDSNTCAPKPKRWSRT